MPPKGTKIVGPRKLPPLTAELEAAIRNYFARGMSDKDIVDLLLEKHIDTKQYSMSYQSFRKMCRGLGLESTRGQGHTVESVHNLMLDYQERHANSGVSDTINRLGVESGGQLRVPRSVVEAWNHTYEPEKVVARRSHVTPKKPFVCAGVNELWAFDQHDKWGKWGIWLHAGLDTYSGLILWFKVWWTNSNPRLICKYYLDVLEEEDPPRMPMLTQSDPGTENFGIANAQSTLRQMLDPNLEGTMQHIHSRKHGNIKPEIHWSLFRRREAPDLEAWINHGVERDIFNTNLPIHYLTFRYVFMPAIQAELDLYTKLMNTKSRRANRKSTLPTAAPINIYERPNKYGAQDFKILVPREAVQAVRELYANPGDSVFQFLPPDFARHAERFYLELGGEPIERANAWFYFLGIVDGFANYELSMVEQQQLLYERNLFNMLLEHSRGGSTRGDAWGYNVQPIAEIEMFDAVGSNQDDMENMTTGEMSDEEVQGSELAGHDW